MILKDIELCTQPDFLLNKNTLNLYGYKSSSNNIARTRHHGRIPVASTTCTLLLLYFLQQPASGTISSNKNSSPISTNHKDCTTSVNYEYIIACKLPPHFPGNHQLHQRLSTPSPHLPLQLPPTSITNHSAPLRKSKIIQRNNRRRLRTLPPSPTRNNRTNDTLRIQRGLGCRMEKGRREQRQCKKTT